MTRSNAFIRGVEHAVMRIVSGAIGLGRGKGPARPEPRGAQTVLICKWCCLGDAVVSLYAIREFKRTHPETAIDMLVSARIADVYRRAPEIRDVHVLPVTGRRLILELLHPKLWIRLGSLVRRLRRSRYAQFIDLELYRATGPILKRLLGIPFSRGFQVEGALPKHHDSESPMPRSMPEWQGFYRVLGLEIPEVPPEALYPRAPASARDKRIGVVFGSSFNWPQKKWPWRNYADLISLMSPEGHVFVLLGAPGETEDGVRIAASAKGKVVDTTGRLDFDGLRREVSACDAVVGNDTGTMHLAAACGVPTVTLFGPTDPDKWNPLTSTPVFLKDIPCRPCYYLGSMPACSHLSCLRKMEPALVAEAVRRVLSGIPERAAKASLAGNGGESVGNPPKRQ